MFTCPLAPYVPIYRGDNVRLVMHAIRCPACLAALITAVPAYTATRQIPLPCPGSEILVRFANDMLGLRSSPARALVTTAVANHVRGCVTCLEILLGRGGSRLEVDLNDLLEQANVALAAAIESQQEAAPH